MTTYLQGHEKLYPLGIDTKSHLKGPHLLPGAKIGANATLLPGVVIGRNALVGAGVVVVHNVPDGKVVVGSPARIIKDVSELSAYDVGRLANSVSKNSVTGGGREFGPNV